MEKLIDVLHMSHISDIEDALDENERILSSNTCLCGRMSICGFDCEEDTIQNKS